MSSARQKLIVFSCMLLQAIPYGLAQNVPPLFIEPLRHDFGFSLQSVGYIFTIGAVAASLVAPGAGKIYQKHSTKWVMMGGMIVMSCGILFNSIANQLWMFLVASAVTQMGCIVFSGLGIPYLIATWFSPQEKSTALGIAFAGGSIGNFFLQPIVEQLLAHFPLHICYLVCGLAALIVGVLVILFLIKENKPGGAKVSAKTLQGSQGTKAASDSTHAADQAAGSRADTQSTLKSANNSLDHLQKGIGAKATMKLKAFWLIAFSYLIIGLAIAALSAQYADYFHFLHLGPKEIGMVGSCFAIACLLGNLMGGVLFSKLGMFKAMFIAMILQTLAVLCMLFAFGNSSMSLIWAFGWAILYGLNVYSYMSAPSLMMQGIFGMRDSSQILGIFSIFFAVGFAVGNIVFGFLVDKMGFFVGWTSILCYSVIGFVLLLFFMKHLLSKKYYDACQPEASPASKTA